MFVRARRWSRSVRLIGLCNGFSVGSAVMLLFHVECVPMYVDSCSLFVLFMPGFGCGSLVDRAQRLSVDALLNISIDYKCRSCRARTIQHSNFDRVCCLLLWRLNTDCCIDVSSFHCSHLFVTLWREEGSFEPVSTSSSSQSSRIV